MSYIRNILEYFHKNKDSKYNIINIAKSKAYSDSSKLGKDVSIKSNDNRRTLDSGKGFSNYNKNYLTNNGRIVRCFEDYYKGVYIDSKKHGDFYVDGKHSIYIGRHPFRIGTRGQKYKKVADPMFELFHLNKDLFNEVDMDIDKAIVMSGSYDSNKHILQRTMIPDYPIPSANDIDDNFLKEYDDVIKSVLRKIINVRLNEPNYSDLLNVYYNPKTLPGFHYEHLFGMMNKNDASETAFYIARSKWNYIESSCRKGSELSRKNLFPTTYTIGARNKRDYYESDGDVITSRAIHMPEFHDEVDIGLILTLNLYFMLLSYDSNTVNSFTSYIKSYIQN